MVGGIPFLLDGFPLAETDGQPTRWLLHGACEDRVGSASQGAVGLPTAHLEPRGLYRTGGRFAAVGSYACCGVDRVVKLAGG